MNNQQIIKIIEESSAILNHKFNRLDLNLIEINNKVYNRSNFEVFKRDLLEAGTQSRMVFLS